MEHPYQDWAKKHKPATGKILIAKPFIPEPLYQKSVVLIVHHDDRGTTGLILNHRSAIQVKEALESFSLEDPLWYGGPIDSNLVTFIHRIPPFTESVPIGSGLFWGGNLNFLKAVVDDKMEVESSIHFFAGLTAWKAGELDYEINNNYWWLSDINPAELFNKAINDLHAYALIRDENLFGILDEIPDPVMN